MTDSQPVRTRKPSSARAKTDIQVKAELAVERNKRLGSSFRSFTSYVTPSFQWYRHCAEIAPVLDRVALGEIKRLMVFLPPRHSKSETISRHFPAYDLFKNPTHQVGLTSYSADLAFGLSRSARDNYLLSKRGIRDDVSAVGNWETIDGGTMWSAGVGGPITGRGANVIIIDDPIKNAEEASSALLREKHKEWYRSTLYTRLEPQGAVILVMTRWHEDDLAGWLLSQESQSPERWYILSFDAIRSADNIVFPPSCHLHPDWRNVGEALCPERYDADRLAVIASKVGSSFWRSLFQQRPTAEEGNIWKRDWFKVAPMNTNGNVMDIGIDWDLAYTKDDKNSACAWVTAGRDGIGNMFVLDAGFDWLEFPDLIRFMASKKLPHYVEAKASGKSAVQTLKDNRIFAEEVTIGGADKISRAKLATPPVEAGKVFVMPHVRDMLLNDERQGLLRFPNAQHDDLNDAFVQAVNRLLGGSFMTSGDYKNIEIEPSITSRLSRQY